MSDMKFGDIIIFSSSPSGKDGILTKLQHWFTHEWTNESPKKFLPGLAHHCAIYCDPQCDTESIFEADLTVTTTPWSKSFGSEHIIYRPRFTEAIVRGAAKEVYNRDAGGTYGIFKYPYYLVRFFAEKLHFDARRWWNPSPNLTVCSTEIWFLAVRMAVNANAQDLLTYLNEWKSENFHSSDAVTVMKKFPQYFENII